MIIHPQDLEESALYAIDQFVLRGGRAIVFLDPNAINSQPQMTQRGPVPPKNTSSDLPKLMKAWGLEMIKDKVVGDRQLATRVRANPRPQRHHGLYFMVWGQKGRPRAK